MARITKTFVLSAALFALACSSNTSSSSPINAAEVTDTLGNKFSASCSTSFCALSPKDSLLAPFSCTAVSYGTDTFVMLWSRILMIHVMNVASGSVVEFNAAEPSRPVACAVDTDCSMWNATISGVAYQYTCVNSICQAVSQSMSTNDVIALCQADIPWPSSCPYITTQPFASRMAAVGVSCGANKVCSNVPAECKQPVPGTAIDSGVPPAPGIDAGTPASIDAGTPGLDGGLGLL